MKLRLLILLAATCVNADAVDPYRAMSQYVRDRWGAEQGFPRGAVYAIAQTTDGYLWIASQAGLVRFDGLNFRLVKDETGAVSFDRVLGLVPDRDGSLWLRLADSTLLHYRNGEFDEPFAQKSDADEITSSSSSNQGKLLAARMQMGAFTYGSRNLKLVAAAEGIPRSPVISIAQDPTGDVWLGTRGSGLFHLKDGKTIPITQGLPDTKVNCLLPDGPNSVWVGTDGGIARWNGSEMTTRGIPSSLLNFQALALSKDRDGNLWIGTDSRGLLRFNSQGVFQLERSNGDAAVTAVFEDREGNVWLGSTNGIERLRDSAFVTYSMPEGLPTEGNNPLYVDANRKTWFAPVAGGLWWLRDEERGRESRAGLGNDTIYSIAGGKDELWLGRQRGGLTRLTLQGGITTYTHADGLAQDSVYSVYRARDGVVWAGTLSRGVSKLDHGKFTTYTVADGLAANTVASMLETRDGAMWFATPGGLSVLSAGLWRTFTAKDGLPSDDVNCLLEDSAGMVWAGTTAGLAILRGSHFVVSQAMPAPLKEQVLGIAEDRFGSLWIATSDHVLRVNREKLIEGALQEGDSRQYGLADGLRGVEGVKRHPSVIADSIGRIWFSLNQGISVVDPARLKNSGLPASAQVRSVSADGKQLELKGSVRVPTGRQRIVFSFAALSLSVPERVRYRYKLEHFDQRWSEPVEGREAVYTNLTPGAYTFKVLAANPDGVWSTKEAELAFSVDPAFWQTWWFRGAASLGCILALLALYRLWLHQLTATLSLRFEERLAERTRIAQELHDTLLQGFLSASMHVHVAADQLPEDSRVKPTLTYALKLMRQVIEEGRNVVRGLRTTESQTLDLEQAFSQIPAELAPSDQFGPAVAFRVIVEGKRRALHPIMRDEVYRIGREALINAFRHSKAKTIEIELKYSARRLKLLIRDDGCGIDPETLVSGREGHWGLSGMRERAERIRARLKLWSAVSAGTEIELSVPGSIAFQDQRGTLARWFRK